MIIFTSILPLLAVHQCRLIEKNLTEGKDLTKNSTARVQRDGLRQMSDKNLQNLFYEMVNKYAFKQLLTQKKSL